MSLKAEITQLYEGGAVILPTAANEYVGAATGMHNSSSYDHSGFGRTVPVSDYDPTTGEEPKVASPRDAMSPDVGGGPIMKTGFTLGQMQESYVALRDTFHARIINQTYKNLVSAGQALVAIAEDYARTDGDAAAALTAEKEKLKDQIPDLQKPPQVGDEPPPPK